MVSDKLHEVSLSELPLQWFPFEQSYSQADKIAALHLLQLQDAVSNHI